MSQKKSDELIVLYTFYAKETVRQGTQRIWSTTGFTANGLGWKEEKVRRVKKRLIDLKLVEDVPQKKTENGKWAKAYLRIRYVISAGPPKSGGPEKGESQKEGVNSLGVKDAVERRNSKKEVHPTGTRSDDRVSKVDTEWEAEIINLYHGTLCSSDNGFWPITKLTGELKKAICMTEDWGAEYTEWIFRKALKEGTERTLLRILWSNYETDKDFKPELKNDWETEF